MKKVLMLMLVAGSLFAKCELVVVSTTWCPACKMQGKILKDKSLTKYIEENNIVVTKYDADSDNVPKQFQTNAIPYTFVVSEGEILSKNRGVHTANELKTALGKGVKASKKSEGTK